MTGARPIEHDAADPHAEGDVPIELGGHRLVLLAERAVFWPARRWLLVADTHWGKCQALRQAGAAVPSGPMQADLQRLAQVAERVGARRLVVLGDLVHGPAMLAQGLDGAVARWRRTLACELALVPGNHDRRLVSASGRAVLERWGIELLAEQVVVDGLALRHEPPMRAGVATLCGHVHPAARLGGRHESIKLPCFWLESAYNALVLPAFSGLVDGVCVAVSPDDRRWATTGQRVVALSDAPARSAGRRRSRPDARPRR
ncbi:MAG: DEAD/DEAH box helicase [Phycisphaerales bacterium]|nr:MAG: DEAD/DEAH box helicase [Phycisphaerales bacterium]